jgi:hypothetical protein
MNEHRENKVFVNQSCRRPSVLRSLLPMITQPKNGRKPDGMKSLNPLGSRSSGSGKTR